MKKRSTGPARRTVVKLFGFFTLVIVIVLLGVRFTLLANRHTSREGYSPSPIAAVFDVYQTAHPDPIFLTQPEDCSLPRNKIVAENCLPGTEDWIVRKNSFDILGFASSTSINKGETIQFYIDTPSPQFEIIVFRLGYYSGKGARLIRDYPNLKGGEQPACNQDSKTGLLSCSNWKPSFILDIPNDWVSGIYMVKLVQEDTQGENYIPFVVRDDSAHSDILYQQSVATYQAYNNYGGKSLYSNNSNACLTISGTTRSIEVSFDRPYLAPMGDPSTFFRAEYPMVRWLEAQGYWVSYSTDLDTHQSGKGGSHNALLEHKAFLAVGHDEYWSQEMRDAVTAARDAGVSLGIFSANTSFWKVRIEPDLWSGKADRRMVAYKLDESGNPDPGGILTTTWRGVNGTDQPENGLFGIQYIGDNEANSFPLRVTSDKAADPLFRHTGLENIPAGSFVNIGKNLVGWEWDAYFDNGASPDGVTVLMESPVFGEILQDTGGNLLLGQTSAQTTYYQAPSGAFVFASGTIQWSHGLDLYEPDSRIQQITYNIFKKMGLDPATPGQDLIVEGENTENKSLQNSTASVFLTDPPITTDLRFEYLADGSAVLGWKTNKSTSGQVWLMDSSGSLNEASVWNSPIVFFDEDMGSEHHADLFGLEPGKMYYFQIVSQDSDGNISITPQDTFTMPEGDWAAKMQTQLDPIETNLICTVKPVLKPLVEWLR